MLAIFTVPVVISTRIHATCDVTNLQVIGVVYRRPHAGVATFHPPKSVYAVTRMA